MSIPSSSSLSNQLKEVELHIQSTLQSYEDMHSTYISALETKNTSVASSSLQSMDELNKSLISYLEKAQTLSSQIEQKQQTSPDKLDKDHLHKLSNRLNQNKHELKKAQEDLESIEGSLSSSKIEQNSNYIKSIFFFILFIIAIVFVSLAFIRNEPSWIELLLFTTILVFVLYQGIQWNF
jgi:NADH:ubiquinone oxidoreductase subunit 3 (subunit A)